jgi:hypothetical protein
MAVEWLSSYLTSRHKLEGPESSLHLGHRVLQIIEGGSNLLLDLAGLSPGGRVGRDLVEGSRRHRELTGRRIDGREERETTKFKPLRKRRRIQRCARASGLV